MLLRVRIVCSAPSARAQIGTVGQFRQLHYAGQCKSGLKASLRINLESRPAGPENQFSR